jgi:hypothetical protein
MTPRLIAVLGTLALVAGAALAADTRTREYDTPDGHLIVTYGQPESRPAGPPPDFEALDRDHNGQVDEAEARGYAVLANDFINADLNHDGRISTREYAAWLREPVH